MEKILNKILKDSKNLQKEYFLDLRNYNFWIWLNI
jgi:hypothetical protein